MSSKAPAAAAAAVKNAATNAATNAANATKNVAAKSTDFIKDMWENKGPVIIFILAVLLVFIIVIIYITFALKNANLKGKVLVGKPIKMDDQSVPFEVSSADIPKTAVGREYSYSFWIYIHQWEQTPGNNKLVFYRGARDDVGMANPIVMMDAYQNKLHVCIKTQDNSLPTASMKVNTTSTAINLKSVVDNNRFLNPSKSTTVAENMYLILTVDYVPIQRWVNIQFIVDNKIMTCFMDGEIYSVLSVDEVKASSLPKYDAAGNPVPVNPIVDKTDGNIYVGKNSINDKVTVNGYISKLEFFNFAISLNQVKRIYNAGPMGSGGFFSKMGIQYGIRSPVYKLDENVK